MRIGYLILVLLYSSLSGAEGKTKECKVVLGDCQGYLVLKKDIFVSNEWISEKKEVVLTSNGIRKNTIDSRVSCVLQHSSNLKPSAPFKLKSGAKLNILGNGDIYSVKLRHSKSQTDFILRCYIEERDSSLKEQWRFIGPEYLGTDTLKDVIGDTFEFYATQSEPKPIELN